MTSKRILSVMAAAILGGSLLSGTAAAEAAGGPTAGRENCVYNIDTKVTKCYASYAEASASIGGEAKASSDVGITAIWIATLWGSGSGSTPSYQITGNSCGYNYGNLPSGMNDKTTSITVANGCRVNLWTNSNQSGNFEVHYGGFSWAVYNDQASSFETFAA